MEKKIHIILTGGTIDSEFSPTKDRIEVLEETGIPKYIKKLRLYGSFEYTALFLKDSRDIRYKDREKILEIHAKGKPMDKSVKLREIAERTPGFSGADLENLVNEAAILAARKDKKKVNQKDLLSSIEKVLLGPERKSHLLNEKEKEIAAWHEAGHALIAQSLGEEKVRKVSIIARGLAAGYTLKMPEEEKRLKVKTDFLNQISIFFGGYAAEKMKFGETSTGASDDLRKATRVARKLVTEFGMSSLGPVSFEKESGKTFEENLFSKVSYSEETAARIDKEVEKLINKGRKQAEKILKENKEVLEELAVQLVKKETLEREEFEKIVEKE